LKSKPRVIVATSSTGLIGINGRLPWVKPADLKRFKRVTMGGVLIVGRTTWESIGRPLPGRKTFVLTRSETKWEGVEVFRTLPEAIEAAGEGTPVWIAGGTSVYAEGLSFCDELDITVVRDPKVPIWGRSLATIDWYQNGQVAGFTLRHEEVNPEDPTLTHQTFTRDQ